MSKWMAGNIEKQIKQRPVVSAVAYGVVGLAAMAAATPTGALLSLAGAVMGGLVTALPTIFNNRMSKGMARTHTVASAAVGALFPFGAVAYGTYQAFSVAKLFARRSESAHKNPAPGVMRQP